MTHTIYKPVAAIMTVACVALILVVLATRGQQPTHPVDKAAYPLAPNLVRAMSLFPVYPTAVGGNVVDSVTTTSHTISHFWTTKATVPSVMNWYKKALTDDGWVIVRAGADSTDRYGQTIVIEKDDIRGTVSISWENQKEPVTIALELTPLLVPTPIELKPQNNTNPRAENEG